MVDARCGFVTILDARAVARVLAEYHARTVDIEVSEALTLRMTEAHHTPRYSYWSRLWPSSIALAQWVLAEDALASHSKELGCGVGLVSLALAHRGVLAEATDRVPHALAFTTHNAAQNAITGVTTSHLDWAQPCGVPSTLVVGADIVYEELSPERVFALVETAGMLVPGGRLVISGPHRRRLLFEDLRKMLVAEGYAHREQGVIVNWEGGVEMIDVHVLGRP